MSTLHIKNMVCNRCIRVVRDELEKLGHHVERIELGKVDIKEEPGAAALDRIRNVMQDNGFELLDDRKTRIIAQIKTIVINRIHYPDSDAAAENFSDQIAGEIGMDYSYLSNLFSSVEGITIEKYIILQKIERVKELLVYDELSLSEIAYRMGYSSVAHLSSQFKKVTGLTPSAFKELQDKNRKPLDKV